MIIWLASYPKSGNTWLRSFLISLLYPDKFSDFRGLKIIGQYPKKIHFKGLLKDFSNFEEISQNWVNSQNKINSDKKLKFFKTHHSLCNYKGHFFTNTNNTLGAIYLIRDPRNVLISIFNHFSKKNYNEAKEFLFDENRVIGLNKKINNNDENLLNNEIITIISSWKTHYRSWKLLKKNYLLIKYEDLLSKPQEEFSKISDYISFFTKMRFSNDLIEKAINENSFKNLSDREERFGFDEAPIDKSGKKKKFFNLGPKNVWESMLNKQMIDEINKKFQIELEELNYL